MDLLEGLDVDAPNAAVLRRFGFDREQFEAHRARLRLGAWQDARHRVHGLVQGPLPADGMELAAERSAERARRGTEAIARGEVAAVVLAGGMATRFGGVVKAAVDALPGRTFFALKTESIETVAARAGGRVPIAFMTSFATEDAVRDLLAPFVARGVSGATFAQFVSLRMTPGGDVFREADGSVSPYAPGHGDLTFAMRAHGALAGLRARGVRTVYVSNVDNLAASLDPEVLGAHLESGAAASVEVVDKVAGDRGGAPARVDGVPQIVESFRFPEEFDQDTIPVFNTNTFWFDAAAIDRDFDLTWCHVKKVVEGRDAVQMERLVGEVTRFLPTRFVRVPRHGGKSRFLPVKDPPELEQRRPVIEQVMRRIAGESG